MAITCTITAPDVDGEGPTRLQSWMTPVKTFVVPGNPLFVLSRAGKAFEFSFRNQGRWKKNRAFAGYPAVRHPVYGVHLGLVVGLPEQVIHCIGGHSMHGEGALIESSLEGMIVKYCDNSFWRILERAWERRQASSG